MKRLTLALFMLFTQKTLAEVITATGMPTNYNIYRWNYGENEVNRVGYNSGTIKTFQFDIPPQFIIRTKDHSIDLWQSLENWRENTPIAPGNPRTVDNNGTFPFMQAYDPVRKKLPTADHHIALSHILLNRSKYPDLKFTSNDGSEIVTEIPEVALVGKLDDLVAKEGSSVNCRRNSGKAEECMVCNCVNEALGEDFEGKVNINRTVLRRIQGRDYPNTICGVIWQRAQFSWTANPPPGINQTVKGSILKECVSASKESIARGAWEYDSFYNPALASPSWSRASVKSKRHMNHDFHKLKTFRLRSDGDEILESVLEGTPLEGVE